MEGYHDSEEVGGGGDYDLQAMGTMTGAVEGGGDYDWEEVREPAWTSDL